MYKSYGISFEYRFQGFFYNVNIKIDFIFVLIIILIHKK